MNCLDIAIKICDASFTEKQLRKHFNSHGKEMGMNFEQYRNYSEIASLSSGPDWISYKRKDGAKVNYNCKTKEYTVSYGNNLATYHNRRPKQVMEEMKREGLNIPDKLKLIVERKM